MPVRTASLTHPAGPARLDRVSRPPTPRTGMRLLAAAVGALLLAAGFPPFAWWWAVPLGIAALVASVHGARFRLAALVGAWSGGTFALANLGWLSSVGWDALAAMTVLVALWWAMTMLGVRLVLSVTGWPLFVPAIWVLQEWVLASWPFGGFPWSRLGFAGLDSPLAGAIPVVGVYGMTFLLALIGTAIADVIVSRRLTRTSLATALLVVGVAVIGYAFQGDDSAQALPMRVAAVQGGPQPGMGEPQARAVLAAHAAQTRALAARHTEPPALVVWPESSTDIDPFTDPQTRAQIDTAVSQVNAPVLVGAVIADTTTPNRVRNQVIAWLPETGPASAYTKRHLVPFGEYVPGRDLLTRLSSRFEQVPRDFVAGQDPPVLKLDGLSVGVLICYEVAFDGSVREAIAQGATLLAVPTNNATYAGTAQPAQQLAIERFRALEAGRPVLVASTTGISAVIDHQGAVLDRIDDGSSGVVEAFVSPRSSRTPAVLWGGSVAALLALVGIAGLARGLHNAMRGE